MSEKVTRPKADKKKIHSKNEFELCYLRHQYFRRTTSNPTAAEMKPYLKIIRQQSYNNMNIYRNLLNAVGFDVQDLISIGSFHLVSFLGLFSLEKMPAKYEDFVRISEKSKNTIPSERDCLEKNKANFTMFLNQRMEDLIRVCRQKARNIKGYPAEQFHIYHGTKKPPRILRNLINHYEEYGYRKLDIAMFKSIRKRANVPADTKTFKYKKVWYICVPIEQRSLNLVDFSGADMDPYDNYHNHTPEQVFFNSEEEKRWENTKNRFDGQLDSEKARHLRTFIAKYEDKPGYTEELKLAKKWLDKLERLEKLET